MRGTVQVVISPVDFTVETVDGPDGKRLMLALCSMCFSKINHNEVDGHQMVIP